jgi:putative membrane protein
MDSVAIFFLLKATHVVAVISWMAGLLYLPRLFVYHCGAKRNKEADMMLRVMEERLLRVIMNPAMIVTILTGIGIVYVVGFGSGAGWLHFKSLLVVFMMIFHMFLSRWRKDFVNDKNKNSERFYRIANEVPTILLIFIVFLVIFKPF